MAETPKIESLENSDIPKITEPTTGVVSTAPVSEVIEPNITLPEPVVEPTVTEPIVEPVVAPVIEEPVVEPTIKEPAVTEPVIEPTIEPVKTTPTEKVESVQDINAKETANESNDNALNEQKKTQVVTELQQMVANGATIDELQSFGTDNQEYVKDIATALRGSLKNVANVTYFGKYSTLNNEDMYAAYQAGEIVPNSEQYNLLPAAQKARFDAYLSEQETVDVLDKTDFTSSSKVMDMTTLESAAPQMFSSNVRENYEKALNDPRIGELSTKLNENEVAIDDIDDSMNDLLDTVEKAAGPGALVSQLNSRYKDEYKQLADDKRLLLRERKLALGEYQTLKGNAETELKMSMYEDGLAKEEYDAQLSSYNSKIEAMSDAAVAEFEQKNKEKAADVKYQRDLELKAFEAKLKANDNTGGTYSVDKDGRKVYMVNGTSTIVTDTAGDVVYEEVDEEAGFKDTVNFDKETGTYYTHRAYKDGTIQEYSSDINGDRVGPSLNTVDFIASKEGFRDTAYLDSAGVWTVGYGFTNIDGKQVQKGDTISQSVADSELQKQISEYTNFEDFITVDLSEEQKTALNSFEYNLGKGIWRTTGKGIIDALNDGDIKTATKIMNAHNQARDPKTGELREIAGLTSRRLEESELLKSEFDVKSKYSQEAQDWANNISTGKANIANVPDSIRTEVSSALANIDITLDGNNPVILALQGQLDIADEIIDWDLEEDKFFEKDSTNESLVEDISGGIQFSAFDSLTGEKGQFLGKIQFLLDEQPLQKLIDIKAQGGTFGALSEKELALLKNSSSLLNSARKEDDDGNITGFNMSEADMKKHLILLRDGYKKAIESKTGKVANDLDSINAQLDALNEPVYTGNDLSSSLEF